MFILTRKLKQFKGALKEWSRKSGEDNVATKIKRLKEELFSIQSNPILTSDAGLQAKNIAIAKSLADTELREEI